ncbi:hypothetical protein Pst134EA_029437 [Puccinia striiformis f. sp. tritici]|uniref:hypothetical protein n=1 Tax=Puccinia striiformis f. sp. tritici TaxID=168172 RepID=UPI002008B1B5|nr:hypothetical protein Pst134EA_029437 [Puccinia striiformis f. sp. tritici]KAH9447399.1 hypothetical protein Pst134EA_029437 [Puccinia striiformis f. sp. tritici]KAI9624368.1 hypothetical protein KEM48_008950 [Puccinia striiformis f. sp. tritici PST-130]
MMNEQWSRKICYQTNNDYETRIRQLEDVVHLLLARSELQRPPPSFTSIAPVGSFRYSRYKGLVPLLSKSTSESLATDWKKSLLGGAYPPSLSSFRSKSSQPSPQSIPHRRLGAENWLSVDPNPNPSQLVSLGIDSPTDLEIIRHQLPLIDFTPPRGPHFIYHHIGFYTRNRFQTPRSTKDFTSC